MHMKITQVQTGLIALEKVPNFTVVRYLGKLYFKSLPQWVGVPMDDAEAQCIYGSYLVEVVDAELIVEA